MKVNRGREGGDEGVDVLQKGQGQAEVEAEAKPEAEAEAGAEA